MEVLQAKHRTINQTIRNFIATPITLLMFFPLVGFDMILEFYHRVCFFILRIPYIGRRRYIKIDRHRLSYLDGLAKIGCVYCGYVNGLMHYASVIVGRTEQYWCAIMHDEDPDFVEPPHHKTFLPYGDEEAFKKYLETNK